MSGSSRASRQTRRTMRRSLPSSPSSAFSRALSPATWSSTHSPARARSVKCANASHGAGSESSSRVIMACWPVGVPPRQGLSLMFWRNRPRKLARKGGGPSVMPATLDWLGVSTFRLTINDLVIFLDAYIDRVAGAPPVGIATADIDRADYILIGYSHFDHL